MSGRFIWNGTCSVDMDDLREEIVDHFDKFKEGKTSINDLQESIDNTMYYVQRIIDDAEEDVETLEKDVKRLDEVVEYYEDKYKDMEQNWVE